MSATGTAARSAALGSLTAREISARHAAEWDALLRTHPMARSIVPMWETLAGWSNHDIGLFDGERLVGGLILSMQRVPFTPAALGRINCLMVGPGRIWEMTSALFEHVERLALRHGMLETELRLRLPASGIAESARVASELRAALGRWGYTALTKTDSTYLVRIDKDDEALLNQFERSARNKIRKAQRAGVVVENSRDFTLLDDFYDAYLDMCRRKRAPVQPEALVGRGLRPVIERGHALLLVERYPAGIASMVVVDALGTPCYVLGARSRANVRGEVPGAAQVLQYEAMRLFRDRGHVWYDLGGCEGPVPIEGHHNYGVWRFKYGFGGEFARFLPYMRKVRWRFERVLRLAHVLRGDFV